MWSPSPTYATSSSGWEPRTKSHPHDVSIGTIGNRLAEIGLEGSPEKTPPHHLSCCNKAGVLALISRDQKVLLTKRSQHLRHHAGEVSLPGGKQEDQDLGNVIATALREANEEVGLKLQEGPEPNNASGSNPVKMLCQLSSILLPWNLCIHPLVAMHEDKESAELQEELALDHKEVETAFWVPLSFFLEAQPTMQFNIPWEGKTYVWRDFRYQDPDSNETFQISGLTSHILHEVAHEALVCPLVAARSGSVEWQQRGSSSLGVTTGRSSGYLARHGRRIPRSGFSLTSVALELGFRTVHAMKSKGYHPRANHMYN